MNTTVILASGPSLTQEDADAVRAWRDECSDSRPVTVINSTFRMAPWADTLYSNDDDWVGVYLDEIKRDFAGRVICGHPDWRGDRFVQFIPFDRDAIGLQSPKAGHIAWGMNSGSAAISLAVFQGARRIILLGYDQQWTGGKPRWHGRHPDHLQNQKPGFHRWATWFSQAAIDADACGIQIVNASRDTSLTCFPRVALEDVL